MNIYIEGCKRAFGKTKNSSVHRARRVRFDEYFTKYEDIVNEIPHYTPYLKNKIIYCNCDNAKYSNFPKFFLNNFKKLELKQLICTHITTEENPEITNCMEFSGEFPRYRKLVGDDTYISGDFRSNDCLSILDTADIVITNPPFSLFRDFIELLVLKDKKFIVIGNLNAIRYKKFFPLIKEKKIWLGTLKSSGLKFTVPVATEQVRNVKIVNGVPETNIGTACWFTNLPHNTTRTLELNSSYSPEKYPTYDNYNAIEVSRIENIPADYTEEMGVPITFLLSHNPKQFDIMGFDRNFTNGTDGFFINGKEKFTRIVIKRKT